MTRINRNVVLLLFAAFLPAIFALQFSPDMSVEEYREKLLEEELDKKIELENLWDSYALDDAVTFYSPTFDATIEGIQMESHFDKRIIYGFRGFKYAQSKGENNEYRFKPPGPPGKYWTGDNIVATKFGDECPQLSTIASLPKSEDCLYLNVYTPYLPGSEEAKKLPVMFFIHGGAFVAGSSNGYLPNMLLDHDVILVTINYRLGAFGFFSLNNTDAPGNAALYDMVEALKWVNMYIEDFGGNKNKVTIFGESAGSVSVSYMMLAPQARGLFRAVISESGSSLDPWALDEESVSGAHFIAQFLNCDMDNDTTIYDCVSEVGFRKLILAESALVNSDRIRGKIGFRTASPSLQNFTLGPDDDLEFVVTKRPKKYITDGDFAMVPFMTGANKQEGSFITALVYFEYLTLNGYANDVDFLRNEMLPALLSAIGIQDDPHGIAKSLQEVYCPGIDLADREASWPCLTDILSVFFLKAGGWELTNLHSYYAKDKPAYYYAFEVEEDDTMSELNPYNGGVAHGDEMKYIFPRGMNYTEQMQKTSKQMTKMWTNFATYLDPTPNDQKAVLAEMGVPIWIPFSFNNPSYLLMEKSGNKIQKEYSQRWTITMDEIRAARVTPTTEAPSDECTGQCKEYKDDRDTFMIVMIVFVVGTALTAGFAFFFFYKLSMTSKATV